MSHRLYAPRRSAQLALLLLAVVVAADCKPRPTGQTDFVSADASDGASSAYRIGEFLALDVADTPASEEARSVEEGDIYRVLGNGLILNLNAYRGLQVIDFSDVAAPAIVGRLQVSGSPVELYTVGDMAYVLLNGWHGYYGRADDALVEARSGGVVLAVDLSDPSVPRVVDRAPVPGWIRTSRLTRGGGQAALYVVTGGYAEWVNENGSTVWESRTVVVSFDVSSGMLEKQEPLNLGGYVADVQATPEALLVARNEYSPEGTRSRVSIVEISDPTGVMVEGDEVRVEGRILSQFNMDLYRGVLRVVSAGDWSQQTNYLQTFDASDIHALVPIHRVTFGDGESLFATLFLGNKAFFVTYFRIDPFHAFYISDDGFAAEMSEFVVSGWNDFFRAVLDDSRLIGIGVDDQGGFSQAVSLYDITNLDNPSPLLARAEVEAQGSWSEARWDHRAFSVLEDAVEVGGPEGVIETGLVLLPFSGWNEDRETYTAGVQIFTFSGESLTRRGLMDHGTPVRRSFLAEADTPANLSEVELSLFDTSDSDDPQELGRVELAPDYSRFFVFGDYGARTKDSRGYYYYWWGARSELPPATVEIVSRDEHPDTAEPVASFEIPADATPYQVGDLLVTVDIEVAAASDWPFTYRSTLEVWDLSDPTAPFRAGTLTTDRLQPSYGYWPCPGCDMLAVGAPMPFPGSLAGDVQSVEDALVFLQRHDEHEILGTERVCTTYPGEPSSCRSSADGWESGCSYLRGSITCTSLEGAEPHCAGGIERCTIAAEGVHECAEVDPDRVPTNESCWEHPRYRYWQRFAVDVLDVTDPSQPVLAAPVELPRSDEGVSMLAKRSGVWISFRRPHHVAADARPYVRYFIRRIDLEQPSAPDVRDPVNVPGELLVVDGDTIFTRDFVWSQDRVETAIARSKLFSGRAYLQAKRVFEDQQVEAIALDGAGNVLVSHRDVSHWIWRPDRGLEALQRMSVLDADSSNLARLAEVDVASWATLRDARAGRALFEVPGGLLLFNLDDPTRPFAQAFFATRGWPREIVVVGRQIIFAAGRYGIYAFDLETFNLLSPES